MYGRFLVLRGGVYRYFINTVFINDKTSSLQLRRSAYITGTPFVRM